MVIGTFFTTLLCILAGVMVALAHEKYRVLYRNAKPRILKKDRSGIRLFGPFAVVSVFLGVMGSLVSLLVVTTSLDFRNLQEDVGTQLAMTLIPVITGLTVGAIALAFMWMFSNQADIRRLIVSRITSNEKPIGLPPIDEAFKITEKQNIPPELLKNLRHSIAHRQAAAAKLAEAFDQVSRESFITEPTETGEAEISVATELLTVRRSDRS